MLREKRVPVRKTKGGRCCKVPVTEALDVIKADNLPLEMKLSWIVENWRELEIDDADVDFLLEVLPITDVISLTQCTEHVSSAEKFIRLCTIVSQRVSSYLIHLFLCNRTCFPTSVVTRVITDCCVNLLDDDALDIVLQFAGELNDECTTIICLDDWMKLVFRVSKSLPLCVRRVHHAKCLQSQLEAVRQSWMNGRVSLGMTGMPKFGEMLASVAKTVRQILGPERTGFDPAVWLPFLASLDLESEAPKVLGVTVYVSWESLPYQLKQNQ